VPLLETIPDLWPSDIGDVRVIAPATILRDQAARLGDKTGNLVIATVESSTEKPNFIHSFVISAPLLDGYTCRLLRVKHNLHFYPLEIFTDVGTPNFRAGTQDDLLRALGEVFGSAPVKKLIGSLIVQSRALVQTTKQGAAAGAATTTPVALDDSTAGKLKL
jgi:hypothetical protein